MYSILLVEDERWVRTSLQRIIERTELPYTVVHACDNGLEALDWLKEHEVDLVMTDVRMPVMDGITFVRHVQELPSAPEIVMVSGHDDFHYAQAAMRCGVKDYLLKPVEIQEMEQCLRQALSRIAERSDSWRHGHGRTVRDVKELSPVEQVIHFIFERLPGEVTLQEAAAKVHLNPSYLSQLFKQQMKINFVDYVLQLRMEEANKLLLQTSLRISEIAERLGYADLSYFSNTYKRITGKTPSEYRKENGKT